MNCVDEKFICIFGDLIELYLTHFRVFVTHLDEKVLN